MYKNVVAILLFLWLCSAEENAGCCTIVLPGKHPQLHDPANMQNCIAQMHGYIQKYLL